MRRLGAKRKAEVAGKGIAILWDNYLCHCCISLNRERLFRPLGAWVRRYEKPLHRQSLSWEEITLQFVLGRL